ncbi:hypothetical protein EW146_g8905 [Bondarzewia mesenterica]|uniref:Uncharacterized protein n=1 Tax=Bondarzewia mesenterica TaxID=1095465 RepID=A0A4S4LAJ4_9AGAM|nr:hypothetical protein EW146_g8905 [Bondarzewia mesenterica]
MLCSSMEDNLAQFSEAECGMLTKNLKKWISKSMKDHGDLNYKLSIEFTNKWPKDGISTLPLKLASYLTVIQKWNSYEVIKHKKRKEIEAYIYKEHSVTLSNSKAYIQHYQQAVKSIRREMSAAELKKYDELADKWNAAPLPTEVQRDLTEKHYQRYIKEFAQQMNQQLGMHSSCTPSKTHKARTATSNGVGELRHDYNEENGSISFVKTQPRWETGNILEEWAKQTVDVEADADTEGKKKGKKPLLELAFAEDGRVILSVTEEEKEPDLDQLKGLVQSVMTAAYREASANSKSTVPWRDLKEWCEEYIDDKYLPDDYLIKEPSKMVQKEVAALITHWMARQAEDEDLVVFKAFKSNDGGVSLSRKVPGSKMAIAKGKKKSPAMGSGMANDKGQTKAKRKGKGKGKNKLSVTDADSKAEGDGEANDDILRELKDLQGSDDDDENFDSEENSRDNSLNEIEQWEISIQ